MRGTNILVNKVCYIESLKYYVVLAGLRIWNPPFVTHNLFLDEYNPGRDS